MECRPLLRCQHRVEMKKKKNRKHRAYTTLKAGIVTDGEWTGIYFTLNSVPKDINYNFRMDSLHAYVEAAEPQRHRLSLWLRRAKPQI